MLTQPTNYFSKFPEKGGDPSIMSLTCMFSYIDLFVFSSSGCASFPELLLKFSQLGVPVRGLLHLSPLLLHDDGSAISQHFPSEPQRL